MRTLKNIRNFVALGVLMIGQSIAAQTAMVDVPVGETAYVRPSAKSTAIETEVMETTIRHAAPVKAAKPAAAARPVRRSAPARDATPMRGKIGAEPTLAPMTPDLDSIRRAMDPRLIANANVSSAEVVDPEPTTPEPKPKEVAVYVVDWELSEIVASLTSQTGVNIVLASTSNPKITVRLDKMPIREVVRIIASLANMQVVQLKSGGFVMAPSEVLKNAFPQEYSDQITAIQNPPVPPTTDKPVAVVEAVDVYDVKHVKPSELVEALNAIFEGEDLKIRLGPGKLLPSAVGSDSGSSNGKSGSNGSTTNGAATSTLSTGRTLVFRGPRIIVQEALRLAKQLDTKQPQVAIRVQIHDISDDAMRDLGVSWQGQTNTSLNESNSSSNDINFGSFTRSALSFQASIKHLEKTNKAKILAQPNISVLDQEPGYILIGDRINYPVVTSINSSGQPIFDVREERVGIYLQVSATVNDAERVTLNLYPQVSAISGFLEVAGQGSYPQISTREAKTSVRIKTGETVIIGGLLRDEEIKSIERVPILSQIPFFGELFTRRKTTKNKSQVIISITPQIIETEA